MLVKLRRQLSLDRLLQLLHEPPKLRICTALRWIIRISPDDRVRVVREHNNQIVWVVLENRMYKKLS